MCARALNPWSKAMIAVLLLALASPASFQSPNVLPADVEQKLRAEKADRKPQSKAPDKYFPSNGSPTIRKPSQSFPIATTTAAPVTAQAQLELDFLDWCKHVLGIQTSLEIKTFEYYDYMKALPSEDWDLDDDILAQDTVAVDSLPMIPVRGLAASRDISKGETVIRIPLQALFSVTTAIDKDPVLANVMGPKARRQHGWDELDNDFVAIPLLAVALLHHKKLGEKSALYAYMRLLESTPTDSLPFLWNKERLRSQVSEGIRTVARGIQRDMKDMYATVVQVLIETHPDLFGDPGDDGGSWMFDYDHFQWAFAIVNSRHWQLPIPDLDSPQQQQEKQEHHHVSAILEDEQLPPANMPTEEWVRDHGVEEGERELLDSEERPVAAVAHSFLAPVADLLNFGPPCTRGVYSEESKVFEIIATCDFSKGQEVTFWYSDECDHIMVGLYGFTHPIVPSCPTAEEYRRASEDWRQKAQSLDVQLQHAMEDIDLLDSELVRLQGILNGCDCCLYEKKTVTRLRHEHVRGAIQEADDLERHGVRKMRRERNSEF